MSKFFYAAAFVGALFFLASCASKGDVRPAAFNSPDLFPEGIAYDAKTDTTFLSSVKYGGVFTLSDDGAVVPFIDDDADLISTIGLTVDEGRRRLFAATGDLGLSVKTSPQLQMKLAGVAVYNIDTKERLAFIRLDRLYAGAHLPNEIAVAKDGAAYVTDTFSPVVYKISADLSSSEVFAENAALWSGEGVNLNGIEVLESGGKNMLVVNKNNTGELFAISLADKKITRIALPEGTNIAGADGLIAADNATLIVPHNGGNDGLTVLSLSADGLTATTAQTIGAKTLSAPGEASVTVAGKTYTLQSSLPLNFPTTITRVNASTFLVLNAYLGELFGGKSRAQYGVAVLSVK